MSNNTIHAFLGSIPSSFEGYFVIQLTDEYNLGSFDEKKQWISNNADKILELRVFNQTEEYKLFRGNIGDSFKIRIITEENEIKDYFDESQYMDIDDVKSAESFKENGIVFTTGGGSYCLPIKQLDAVKIKIRYYFDKYTSGQAKVVDWRLVEFESGEGGKQ